MTTLLKGNRTVVSTPGQAGSYTVTVTSDPNTPVDVFLLVAEETGRDRPTVIEPNAIAFYNQPEVHGIRLTKISVGSATFDVPASVLSDNRNISIATACERGLENVRNLDVVVTTASGDVIQYSPIAEQWGGHGVTSGVIGELYKKKGTDVIRFGAVGQGWQGGGIDELLKMHGVDVDPPEAASSQLSEIDRIKALDLAVAQRAPHLVSLTKQVDLSLKKLNISGLKARVVMILDIDDRMTDLYRTGAVKHLAERLSAVAGRLDSDGKLDLFTFHRDNGGFIGSFAFDQLPNVDTSFMSVLPTQPASYGNSGVTDVAEHYFGDAQQSVDEKLPVFLLFVTNEKLIDPTRSKQMLTKLSTLAMFTQFVGIGKHGFKKLHELDTMAGRTLDNAGFVTFPDLKQGDALLIQGLLNEFPSYLRDAKALGVVAPNIDVSPPSLGSLS